MLIADDPFPGNRPQRQITVLRIRTEQIRTIETDIPVDHIPVFIHGRQNGVIRYIRTFGYIPGHFISGQMTGILSQCRFVKNIAPVVHISRTIAGQPLIQGGPELLSEHGVDRKIFCQFSLILQAVPDQGRSLFIIRFIVHSSERQRGLIIFFLGIVPEIIPSDFRRIGTFFLSVIRTGGMRGGITEQTVVF